MTDRTVKKMIFAHKPHLRFQKVGKYGGDIVADDDAIGVIVIRSIMLDTWHYLPAWDIREPQPPWAAEVISAARAYLRDFARTRFNEPGDDVVVCFAHIQ